MSVCLYRHRWKQLGGFVVAFIGDLEVAGLSSLEVLRKVCNNMTGDHIVVDRNRESIILEDCPWHHPRSHRRVRR